LEVEVGVQRVNIKSRDKNEAGMEIQGREKHGTSRPNVLDISVNFEAEAINVPHAGEHHASL
jgi:hypothetical protein